MCVAPAAGRSSGEVAAQSLEIVGQLGFESKLARAERVAKSEQARV
jgi:hypothetical protein